MAEQVLVTGGSGYIASWCIVELIRRGYRVRATVRSAAKQAAVRAAVAATSVPIDLLTFATADLADSAGWDAAVRGCTYVLHVASPLGGHQDLITPARDGTPRVLKAAVDAGRHGRADVDDGHRDDLAHEARRAGREGPDARAARPPGSDVVAGVAAAQGARSRARPSQ